MELFQRVIRKTKESALREIVQEAHWLWTYIRRSRAAVALHILLGVLAIAMSLGTSVASKYLIDAVTGYKTAVIGIAAAVMLGMFLGHIVMKSAANRIGADINIRLQNEIQAQVYSHVLAADWEALEQFQSGDLMQRLTNDVSTVAGGVTGLLPNLISSGLQFLGALGIILFYDPTMAAIALLGVLVSVCCSRVLLRKMRKCNQRMKDLSGDMMAFYEDSLSNMTSIKAFSFTGLFYKKMTALQCSYREAYLKYNRFSVRTTAAISILGTAVSAGCFGWGVYQLWSGAISFGSLTMFLQLAAILRAAFSSLTGLVSTAVSVSTSVGRIMSVIRLPAEKIGRERDFRTESEISISLEQAGFAYQGGRVVLKNVDFAAAPGDLIALTGQSGEGKTTILRMLLGLVHLQSGSAMLQCGEEIIPISAATRSAFAYVPQGNSLFTGTVEDNLRLTKPDAAPDELERVLRAACAYDFVQELPGKMQYVIGGRGKGLSEGQAQRLMVARALLRGAPILLLDEATSALDEMTEGRMLHNLMESGLIRTCIFVTHRPGAMKFCTRQYCVREGEVTLEQREAC